MIATDRIPDWFSKPGDTVAAQMGRRRVTAVELADRLEGGLGTLRGLLSGVTPIDDGIAEVLATELGATPGFWIKRQANYEAALNRLVHAVSPTDLDDWLSKVPSPTGTRAHAKLSPERKRDELRKRLAFFSVNSLRAWELRYGELAPGTQFRTSPSFASERGPVSVWLRQGELAAALIETAPWNPSALQQSLDDLRRLTKISQPRRFLPKLKELLAKAGVAFAVVRTPKGCHASGATRRLGPEKAMIIASFRFRTDDQFWFTIFHEIGHLLLHGNLTFVDNGATQTDEQEREANQFASSCILSQRRLIELDQLTHDRDTVLRFAVSAGVAPGLVVGQLQHRGVIGHQDLNSLKRRWTWAEIEDEALL